MLPMEQKAVYSDSSNQAKRPKELTELAKERLAQLQEKYKEG